MHTLVLMLALHASPLELQASAPAPSYSTMSREQLLRERANVELARPGAGGLALAWIGSILGFACGVTCTALGIYVVSQPGGGSAPAWFLGSGLVGIGLLALNIYFIVTRTPERNRLGAELDIIDGVLSASPPGAPAPAP